MISRALVCFVAGVLVASSAADAATSPENAVAQSTISIPAQDLSSALVMLATESGRNVLFNPTLVTGKRSAPVEHAANFEIAIETMLLGTGLRSAIEADGSATVMAAATTASVVPMTVTQVSSAIASADVSPSALEEVIVTAEKREESLQKTPVSISVMTANEWEQRGFTRLNDLGTGAIPSLRIAPFAGRTSAVTIGMRGVVPFDATQMSRDPTVGIYADGVYLGRVQGLGSELYDVERIEVLKGPQGTLFGRNAVGGALSIVTKQPTGEFGIRQTVGARNYEGYNYAAHVDLPQWAGVSAKIDAAYAQREGYVDNPAQGEWDWGQYERKGVRGSLLWEPMEDVSVLYSGEFSEDKGTPSYTQLVELLPNAPPLGPLVRVQDERAEDGLVGVLMEPSVGLVHGHTLTATWDATPNIEVKSISAIRTMRQSQYDNSGATFTAFVPNGALSRYSLAWVKQDQVSQEFQLVGSQERFKYVAGLYYFRERGRDSAYAPMTARWNATGTDVINYPDYLPRPYPDRASYARAESRAVYGQLTYTPPVLDDRLSLTAGARYTSDEKNGALTALSGQTRDIRFDFDADRVDPAFTAAYAFTDDVNAYIRWGTAYRAGGADSRSSTFRSFGPEEVESWEVGVKSELWERRARLNVAAYYTNYEELQIGFSNPANLSSTETINTDQPATIKGLEVDFAVSPLDGLVVSLGYAYTDWSVDPQINPFTGARVPTAIVFTPRNALSAAADYSTALAAIGTLSMHLGATGQSSFQASPNQQIMLDGYTLIDARVTLSDFLRKGPGELELALWGKNLTDKEYLYYSFNVQGSGLVNARSGVFNEPRTFGLEATYSF